MTKPNQVAATLFLAAIFAFQGDPALAEGWSLRPWSVVCLEPNPCSPADEVYKPLLEHSSRWLDGLGFGPPKTAPSEELDGEFFAAVDDATLAGGTKEWVGLYNPSTFEISLSSEHFFTLGNPEDTYEDPEYRWQESFEYAPVHELFHAVEQGYQDIADEDRNWIWEGMADAILMSYATEFEPARNIQLMTRLYTVPLHKPETSRDEYATWEFWLGVGSQLGSPLRVQYFRDVLTTSLNQNRGLDGVDAALPGGLSTQLPRFLASLPLFKLEPETHNAPLPEGLMRKIHRFPLHVREVAGKGADVEVSSPSGTPIHAQFSLEPNDPDFHLIVNNQVRAQRSASYQLPDGGSQSFDVVVANVASTASESEAREVKLKVHLFKITDYCSMWANVTGDVSGTFAGDGAYYNAFEDGQGVAAGMAAGTAVDPGMHDTLQDLGDMMQGMAEMAEAMGIELDPEVQAQLEPPPGPLPPDEEPKSQARLLFEGWEEELLHSGDDTFGLSLTDIKSDAEGPASGGFADGTGNPFVDHFVLALSGKHEALQGPGLVGQISVDPTSIVVSPGGAMDDDLNRVKFIWEEGEPGYVNVRVHKPTEESYVVGTVEGDLYSEKHYDGRRLKIHVEANFTALEGFKSCIQ